MILLSHLLAAALHVFSPMAVGFILLNTLSYIGLMYLMTSEKTNISILGGYAPDPSELPPIVVVIMGKQSRQL